MWQNVQKFSFENWFQNLGPDHNVCGEYTWLILNQCVLYNVKLHLSKNASIMKNELEEKKRNKKQKRCLQKDLTQFCWKGRIKETKPPFNFTHFIFLSIPHILCDCVSAALLLFSLFLSATTTIYMITYRLDVLNVKMMSYILLQNLNAQTNTIHIRICFGNSRALLFSPRNRVNDENIQPFLAI